MSALAPVVVALSLLVPAGALLRARAARRAAIAMVVAAAGLSGSVLAHQADLVALERTLALLTGMLLGPAVVLAYPGPRARGPVPFLARVAVGGAALLALTVPATVDSMGLVVLLALLVDVWWALDRSAGEEHRAVVWLALATGAAVLLAGALSFTLDGTEAPSPWAVLPFAVVGPALLVGVVRHDATDVRTLVVDVVAHAATQVTVLGVFVGVAAPLLPAATAPGRLAGLGLLATVLAAGYEPVRRVLRASVAQAVLGHRLDTLSAVGLVSERLGERPVEALHAVREALGLPWAAVGTEAGLWSGQPVDQVVQVPLGDGLPALEVGLRPGTDRLARDEERLLRLAGPLLGQAIRLARTAEELAASREQSVHALEEERLRLRRDLHDGLGPLISGLAFTTDAARNLSASDPAGADALLAEVRAQLDTALDDVRRLVYGMRPPALDELGLAEAVRQSGASAGLGLRVVETPDLRLPAAVEVAAFRIAVEAVGNAARHSSARQVEVRFALRHGALHVEVDDDGGPGGPPWTRGVGLSSMSERAAEVGGVIEAGPGPGGGRVRGVLPVRT